MNISVNTLLSINSLVDSAILYHKKLCILTVLCCCPSALYFDFVCWVHCKGVPTSICKSLLYIPCSNFPSFIDWGLSCINHWRCLCNVWLQCYNWIYVHVYLQCLDTAHDIPFTCYVHAWSEINHLLTRETCLSSDIHINLEPAYYKWMTMYLSQTFKESACMLFQVN